MKKTVSSVSRWGVLDFLSICTANRQHRRGWYNRGACLRHFVIDRSDKLDKTDTLTHFWRDTAKIGKNVTTLLSCCCVSLRIWKALRVSEILKHYTTLNDVTAQNNLFAIFTVTRTDLLRPIRMHCSCRRTAVYKSRGMICLELKRWVIKHISVIKPQLCTGKIYILVQYFLLHVSAVERHLQEVMPISTT